MDTGWVVSGIWDKGPHVAELQLRPCFRLRKAWLVPTEHLRLACKGKEPNSQVEGGQPGVNGMMTGRGFLVPVQGVELALTEEMMALAPDGSGTGGKGRAAEAVAKMLLPGARDSTKAENKGGTDLWWGSLRVQVKHDRQPAIDGNFWVQTHERNPRGIH